MRKRSREPKPLDPVLASAAGPALIKFLASCNPRVRSQSLQLIQTWLAAEPHLLSEHDIGKLWKGLFYCLWHSDKMENQVPLINRLTSLFLSLQQPLSVDFFRGFLVTLRREWPGIDRLRLDKFYLLIRRFVRVLLEMFRSRGWDLEIIGEYLCVLDNYGFSAEDKLRGNGVNYHVVSVFLEELKGVGFPVKKEVVDAILRPFFVAFPKSTDKILVGKMKSCLFDELLKMGKDLLVKKKMGGSCEETDGDALLGVVALSMGLSEKFYEIGSHVDCLQRNRKVALCLHEKFKKLEKELESSGIEIAIPDYCDPDEVPQLIPIESHDLLPNGETQAVVEEACNGDDDERPKKRKKVKGQEKKKKKKHDIRKHEKENGVAEIPSLIEQNGASISSSVSASDKPKDGTDEFELNETIILNLQKQFEKVAAEPDSKSVEEEEEEHSAILPSKKHGKRRRSKVHDNPVDQDTDKSINGVEQSAGKSAKKVRFSMKNNLVWKPHNPLPPENLRLPPSVTPRGSALKKGVPPGPVLETPSMEKRMKNKKKKAAQNRLSKATSSVTKLHRKMRIVSI